VFGVGGANVFMQLVQGALESHLRRLRKVIHKPAWYDGRQVLLGIVFGEGIVEHPKKLVVLPVRPLVTSLLKSIHYERQVTVLCFRKNLVLEARGRCCCHQAHVPSEIV